MEGGSAAEECGAGEDGAVIGEGGGEVEEGVGAGECFLFLFLFFFFFFLLLFLFLFLLFLFLLRLRFCVRVWVRRMVDVMVVRNYRWRQRI